MQNPLAHIELDTAPIEAAVGTAFEVITDTFSDVTDSLGEHFSDDVVPLARAGAERTQTFVRTRTRVSVAALAGILAAIGLIVIVKRRRRNSDDAVGTAAGLDRTGPRSVA